MPTSALIQFQWGFHFSHNFIHNLKESGLHALLFLALPHTFKQAFICGNRKMSNQRGRNVRCLWNTFFFCKKLLICNVLCAHMYCHEESNCVPAKALVLSFTKLLNDTVKHSKTNRHFTQMHCSVNISKNLPKHMFVIENKCFYSTAKHVRTKWKLQTAHTVYQTMHTQYTSITQI